MISPFIFAPYHEMNNFHNDMLQPSLLEEPNMKSYHTPSVPRKHARLQV